MKLKMLAYLLVLAVLLAGCSLQQEDEPLVTDNGVEEEIEAGAIPWYDISEASYNGLRLWDSVDKLLEIQGEPLRIEYLDRHPIFDAIYYYTDAEYSIYNSAIDEIKVIGFSDASSIRDIKIGDSFADVLAKFPQEQDYRDNVDGIFYGSAENYVFYNIGYVDIDTNDNTKKSIKIICKNPKQEPYLGFQFENDVLVDYYITSAYI